MSAEAPRQLPHDSAEELFQIHKYPILPIPERGICQKTAELYGIRTKLNTHDGVSPVAYYFPYYDPKGQKIVGYKKRDLLRSKKDSFSSVGEVSINSPFFGINTLGKDKWKLFITEGEFDAPCLHRCIQIYQNKKGNQDKGIHVVSIGCGAPSADEFIVNNQEFLNGYKEVVLVFDNDKATPEEKAKGVVKGQDAVEDVFLALHDYNLKYVKLPLKDPCEMFQAKRQEELVQTCLFNAVEYQPEALLDYEGEDWELDELLTPMEKGIYLKCIPEVSKCLHGFRKREMSVVLAPTKCGKTSLATQMFLEAAKEHNWKVANLLLENNVKKSRQTFAALYHGIRPAVLREKGHEVLNKQQAAEFRDWCKGRLIFFDSDRADEISPQNIVRIAKHCAVKGFDALVLDHISYVISSHKEGNERREIDNMLTDLATIVRNYDMYIHLIAHVKRDEKYFPPRDPETKEVIYPHFKPVLKEHGRGSGAFEQIAWNIICMEPEILDEDGTKGDVRLVVRANREWGEERVCDRLTYDSEKGILV